MFSSPIKEHEDQKYRPNIRAKLNLAGIDKYLSNVTLHRIYETLRNSSHILLSFRLRDLRTCLDLKLSLFTDGVYGHQR